MPKNHGKQIKNDRKYEALRREGASKSKAARIANSGKAASRKGGRAGKYEDRPKASLLKEASKVGIVGRSRMNKGELASALRNH
jgi:hypothetical protein